MVFTAHDVDSLPPVDADAETGVGVGVGVGVGASASASASAVAVAVDPRADPASSAWAGERRYGRAHVLVGPPPLTLADVATLLAAQRIADHLEVTAAAATALPANRLPVVGWDGGQWRAVTVGRPVADWHARLPRAAAAAAPDSADGQPAPATAAVAVTLISPRLAGASMQHDAALSAWQPIRWTILLPAARRWLSRLGVSVNALAAALAEPARTATLEARLREAAERRAAADGQAARSRLDAAQRRVAAAVARWRQQITAHGLTAEAIPAFIRGGLTYAARQAAELDRRHRRRLRRLAVHVARQVRPWGGPQDTVASADWLAEQVGGPAVLLQALWPLAGATAGPQPRQRLLELN